MAIVHSHDAPEGEQTIRTPRRSIECLNSPTSPGADKPFSIATARMLRAANCDGPHGAQAREALPVCPVYERSLRPPQREPRRESVRRDVLGRMSNTVRRTLLTGVR